MSAGKNEIRPLEQGVLQSDDAFKILDSIGGSAEPVNRYREIVREGRGESLEGLEARVDAIQYRASEIQGSTGIDLERATERARNQIKYVKEVTDEY